MISDEISRSRNLGLDHFEMTEHFDHFIPLLGIEMESVRPVDKGPLDVLEQFVDTRRQWIIESFLCQLRRKEIGEPGG